MCDIHEFHKDPSWTRELVLATMFLMRRNVSTRSYSDLFSSSVWVVFAGRYATHTVYMQLFYVYLWTFRNHFHEIAM